MTYAEAMNAVDAGLVVACLDDQFLPNKFVYTLKGKNSIVSHRSLIVDEFCNGDIVPHAENCNDATAFWLQMTPELYMDYRYNGNLGCDI